MEWNNSGIGIAIQTAKSLKALFVVVIHGEEDDENSKQFLDLMNDTEITSLLTKDNCDLILRRTCYQLANEY